MPKALLLVPALLLSLAACSRFDAQEYCRKALPCVTAFGEGPPVTEASCVAAATENYEQASEEGRRSIEAVSEACADLDGCPFHDCVVQGGVRN